MLDVQALPKSFGQPRGFDVLGYLARSIALLPRAHHVQVLLRTDLARARQAAYVELGELTEVHNGVLLKAQADDLDWVARELSRLPFAFKISKPMALRRALAAHGQAMLHSAATRAVNVLR